MVGILKGTSPTVSPNKPPARTDRHVFVVNESTDIEAVIAAHRSLHRFIKNLLNDANVSALETILIQDNASILAKAASQSARVARDRIALRGREHIIITKEISRWESYPFEANNPIVVNKPKKAKNGCVPQRRAKRRSGLESAGEIKADIIKKAESLPRRPRRRSSVANDTTQKTNMQHELLSLFLVEDDDSISMSGNSCTGSTASYTSVSNASAPRRDVSPHRWATMPKKPIRRLSEVPGDITPLSTISDAPSTNKAATSTTTSSANAAARSLHQLVKRPPTKITQLADLRTDSLHSLDSIESTLSEVARRQSDLSSISEQSTELLATLTENRTLDCSVILEEDEHEQQHESQYQNLSTSSSVMRTSYDNTVNSPRKPIRRISDVPEDVKSPMPRTSGTSFALDGFTMMMPTVAEELPRLTGIVSPSAYSDDGNRPTCVDTDEEDDRGVDYNNDNHKHAEFSALNTSVNENSTLTGLLSGAEKPKLSRSVSNPTTRREGDERRVGRSETMPKKPMRRVSEVSLVQMNYGLADGHQEQDREHGTVPPSSPGKAQHSFSTTESTASDTTVASSVAINEIQQPTDCVPLCAR